MKLPTLPADCFGVAVPRMVKCVDASVLDSTDKTETVDGVLMVETESVHWFSGRTPKAAKVAIENIRPDFIIPELAHTVPGSPERIAALQEFYAKHEPEGGYSEADDDTQVSPFTLTDADVADRLANAFGLMMSKNRNAIQDQME